MKKALIFSLILALGFVVTPSLFLSGNSGVVFAEETAAAPEGMEATEAQTVNINTASVEELVALEGIGDKIAQDIVEYRDANGPFNSIEDIKNVNGIGEKKFEAIKDNITVE